MSDEMASALNKACQMFLYPIAKFLLAHGMKFNDFIEVARLAFVQAAADNEDSVSGVAATTGIPRKEVARLKETPLVEVNRLAYEISIPAVILSHWHQDDDFANKDGTPKPIKRTGPQSFQQLIDRIDKSLDWRELLHDLLKSKAIQSMPNGQLKPSMRYFVAQKDDKRRILRYAIRLRDLALTLHRNYTESADLFEASAYKSYVSTETLPVLRRMAREQGLVVLRAFDDWLGMQTEHATGAKSRMGVGFYLFEEADEPTVALGDVPSPC